jgi:hypothetical protein
MDKLSLKDTIGAIRLQLTDSIRAAQSEELRFEVGEIALEFEVQVERTGEGTAGVKFWVVELGGKVGGSSSVTHRVSMHLKPVSSDGSPVITGVDQIPG